MAKKIDPSFENDDLDEEEGLADYDEDDSDSDEDYGEDGDYEEDEEGDEEDGAKQGGWRKKALFATAGLLVVGLGAYYVITNFFPMSKPVPSSAPYANPGAFGKVATARKEPSGKTEAAKPVRPSPVASVAASPAEEPVKKVAPAKTAVKVVAHVTPAVKRVIKPVVAKAEPVVAKAPAVKSAARKVVRRVHARYRVAVRHAWKSRRHAKPKGNFTVQVGAFSQAANAQNLVKSLKGMGVDAQLCSSNSSKGKVSKVLIGNYSSIGAAQKAVSELRGKSVPAVVVRH